MGSSEDHVRHSSGVAYVTTEQMIRVDRAMVEDFRIELVQMMENAGRNLAHLARSRFLNGDPRGRTVVVLAGTGGNGGGALVCARRLHCWGADVQICLVADDSAFSSVPAHQLDIVRRMGIPVSRFPAPAYANAELIVDGIIGYSLNGPPRGDVAALIRWANLHQAPVLSLDVPSGVDASTGHVYDPAIHATVTMTLALPKQGMQNATTSTHVGELYLADISVPPMLYVREEIGHDIGALFARDDIIRLA